MTLSQVLGGIGRTLISAGVIILLFVGFQLWGTGLAQGAAQGDLADSFTEQLAIQEEAVAAAPTAVPAPVEADTVAADAGDVDLAPTPVPTPAPPAIDPELLYSDPGEPISRIVIDAIDVDQVVVEGVSVEDLRKGPGRYRTTSLPGQPGNAAIAGHRTTYGAPFHRVDELKPGDEIKVQTLQGLFTYKVMPHEQPDGSVKGYFIVDPSATEVLSDYGDNRLTLTACHPKFSAAQRIIVSAELVGEPAPKIPRPEEIEADPSLADEYDTDERAADASDDDQVMSDEVAMEDDPELTSDPSFSTGDSGDSVGSNPASGEAPSAELVSSSATGDVGDASGLTDAEAEALQAADDFGEGLGGDRAAIAPSIAWAFAAAAIWLAAWFVGTRWRKWPMYLIGLAPFAFALWTTFDFVDKALPSY